MGSARFRPVEVREIVYDEDDHDCWRPQIKPVEKPVYVPGCMRVTPESTRLGGVMWKLWCDDHAPEKTRPHAARARPSSASTMRFSLTSGSMRFSSSISSPRQWSVLMASRAPRSRPAWNGYGGRARRPSGARQLRAS